MNLDVKEVKLEILSNIINENMEAKLWKKQ